MPTHHSYHASASQIVDAPAEVIYDIITDYHEGHPAILPPRYFTDVNVVKGGQGLGTVVEFGVNTLGTRTDFTMEITETKPHSLIVEEDPARGVKTSFLLEPAGKGRTKVIIETHAQGKPGFQGWVEKWLSPRLLRSIYREELRLLAQVAAKKMTTY